MPLDFEACFCKKCGKGLKLDAASGQWKSDAQSPVGQYCWIDEVSGSELHQPSQYFQIDKLSQIRIAIEEYYYALDTRQHGGAAESRAFDKIQDIMGMSWERGAALKRRTG